jgi:hypothetical protein
MKLVSVLAPLLLLLVPTCAPAQDDPGGIREPSETETNGIACDRGALTPRVWKRHEAETKRLVQGASETKELPAGWSFRETADPATLQALARWVSEERLCCPFIRYEIVVPAKSKDAWLELTGEPGVKDLIGEVILERGRSTEVPPPSTEVTPR